MALFEEAVEILRMGEGHIVPVLWEESGGLIDYRVQNVHIPATPYMNHKWDHVWWDPRGEVSGRGRVPIESGAAGSSPLLLSPNPPLDGVRTLEGG